MFSLQSLFFILDSMIKLSNEKIIIVPNYIVFNPSLWKPKSNRTPHDVINLNQLDLETTDLRDETQLLNFIQSTMDAQFIPGLSISIARR